MNLKKIREKCGITQIELAKYLGVVRSTICQYEKGNREPDTKTLIRLADYFHVSTDYLLGRCDEAGEIIIQSENSFETTPLEQRLILDFRKLPPNMQDNFVTLFHNLAMGA